MKLKVKLDNGAFLPAYAHPGEDAGMDLFAKDRTVIFSNSYRMIHTGVHIELPKGYCASIRSKSGLFGKNGLFTSGLVDSGYTGEIMVIMANLSGEPHIFEPGEKISQMVIEKIPDVEIIEVDEISGGERGSNGFGSTGR